LVRKQGIKFFTEVSNRQGDTMASGHIKKRSFILNYKKKEFKGRAPLPHTNRLYVCEEDKPPAYKNASGLFSWKSLTDKIVRLLCEVTVNLRNLPSGTFEYRTGTKGEFYQAEYELGLNFGSELVLTFLYQGEVRGKASARYV
jgi:hypothetical protein